MLKRSGSLALGVIALVSLMAGSAMAQSKCQGAKLRAAGKKAGCLLGVQSKAVAKNLAPAPTKIAACESKYSAAFAKAETGTTCTPPGDTTTIENKIDTFVSDAVGEIDASPPSKCQSAKIK